MEQVSLTPQTQESLIQKAVEVLSQGEILLYPTDTVYGLGVDATDEDAIAALRDLKGRDEKKPILIMLPSVESIEDYAEMNEEAYRLAEAFLPGPLTLVLPAKKSVSYSVTFNRTVGIRIPNDPFCLALSAAFGKPITTTSANRSGMDPKDTVPEILSQFGFHAESISLAIDAGAKGKSQPSTIVSITDSGTTVLREGALSREVLGL